VAERLAAGTDIVTFSGDKVLGGPQAGLVVGKKHWVSQISRNPLHRAVRCGKLTIAALEATLKLYLESGNLVEDIPTLKAFLRPIAELERVAEDVIPALQRVLGEGFRLTVENSTAQIGSGALPTEELPTKIIAVENEEIGAERIAARFRNARPPILGRIRDGRFLLDLRTIFDPEDLIPGSDPGVQIS
jgi:L-seryl-tRNA(Ser) seleniumtransferase